MSSDTALVCEACGAPLYAQWWNQSRNGYECRRCGVLTAGREAPSTGWTQVAAQAPPNSGLGVAVALGIGAAIVVLATGYGIALAIGIGLVTSVVTGREQRSRARIAVLERQVAGLSAAAPAVHPGPPVPTAPPAAPVVATPAVVAPALWGPAAAAVATQPPVAPAPPVQPAPPSFIEVRVQQLRSASTAELEQLVAGRLLPIIGGVALVVAAILFLGLAFSRGWIGEEGRVLIGLAAGTATYLLGAALLFRSQAVIGHVLVGVGLGVISLAIFAATQLYGLAPPELGILAALIADLSAAALAIRVRSQVLAGLGLVTVLVAPPLTGAEPSLMTVLFLGVALVATTVIAISQSWRWLPSLAFVLTAPQLAVYAAGTPEPIQAVPVLLGFGALNAVAAAGEEWRVLRRELSPSSAVLLVASAGFVVWALIVVLADAASAFEGVTVLVVGLGYLALGGSFLYRGGDRHPFGLLALGTGVSAATLAVPLHFHGAPVPMIWAAEALALTWIYVNRRHPLSGLGALILGLLAAGHLMAIEYPPAFVAVATVGGAGFPFADPAGLALGWTLAVGGAALVILRTNIERSYLAAVLIGLVSWALPHELVGVTLIWAWGLAAVIGAGACWRWLRVQTDDAFPLIPAAARGAPIALMVVVAASAVLAYGTTLATELPLRHLADLLVGQAATPPVPFVDAGSAMVLGLVIAGLASGMLGERGWWRATSVILAASTVAYLLPFELPLAWVVVGWSLLGGALLAGREWWLSHPALGYAGAVLGVLAIGLYLLAVVPPQSLIAGFDPQTPIFNEGTAAALASIGLLAFTAWLSNDPRQRLGFAAAAGVGAVYLVSVMVIDVVEWVAGGSLAAADLEYIGQVALSACWATLGLGTLLAGLAIRSLPVRVFGLALLGVATVKVFIVDLAALDVAFRVLSFVGLGVLLIGAGWIYLRLQGRTAEHPPD